MLVGAGMAPGASRPAGALLDAPRYYQPRYYAPRYRCSTIAREVLLVVGVRRQPICQDFLQQWEALHLVDAHLVVDASFFLLLLVAAMGGP